MQFGRIWVLRGPNLWARFPVIEAELDLLDADAERPVAVVAPSVRADLEYHDPINPDANLADVLLLLTQLWLKRAEYRPLFTQVHRTHRPAFYRLIFDYDEEVVARACLETAFAHLQAILTQQRFDVPTQTEHLRKLGHDWRLGPSTRSIVDAAKRRNIPIRRLNDGSLVQLGWGKKQKRIWTAETDATPAIAEIIAQDKQLTRHLLDAIGVPVPYGRPVHSPEDAWVAAEQEIGLPVVVKPQYGNQGRGVATNLATREQVLEAYASGHEISAHLVVEKYVPGQDHRLLVVGGQLAAAALREPAHVIGDGRSTIDELIAIVNKDPRRSDGHATPLSLIKLDAISLAVLGEQGYTPTSVPAAGTKVLIRRNANLSTGGTATDITDEVHPSVAAHAVDAARAVGLDIAGVDMVVEDIRKPLEEQGGAVVEVNAGPGLRMHLEPSFGTPRDVGAAIVDALFPPRETGRIPIVAVTGTNGKTTTTRVLAHMLRGAGLYVGMTCTDGIYLNGRRTETRDCSGPQSARQVLLNPRLEAAVLETARGGILREGLGFDACNVAIVTNLGKGDHLGLRGIETIDELAHVKEVVARAVEPEGFGILNAGDPRVAAMASVCPGRVVFFGREPEHPVLTPHRQAGGRTAFVRDGKIVLAEGSWEEEVIELAEVPFTLAGHAPFQVENALAAAAAGWCLKLPLATIRAGLHSFTGSADEAPGRFNVIPAGDATVVVDYAHNPSAVSALVAALDGFPNTYRSLVFSGCNRRDIDLIDMGRSAGDAFDRVILYADWGHNGRSDGELNAVLKRGLAQGKRLATLEEVGSEREALEFALKTLRPAELLVAGVEAIEDSLHFVQSFVRDQRTLHPQTAQA